MVEKKFHPQIKIAAAFAMIVHALVHAGDVLVAVDAAERYAVEVVGPAVIFFGHAVAQAAPLIQPGLLPPRPDGVPAPPPDRDASRESGRATMLVVMIGMVAHIQWVIIIVTNQE